MSHRQRIRDTWTPEDFADYLENMRERRGCYWTLGELDAVDALVERLRAEAEQLERAREAEAARARVRGW